MRDGAVQKATTTGFSASAMPAACMGAALVFLLLPVSFALFGSGEEDYLATAAIVVAAVAVSAVLTVRALVLSGRSGDWMSVRLAALVTWALAVVFFPAFMFGLVFVPSALVLTIAWWQLRAQPGGSATGEG